MAIYRPLKRGKIADLSPEERLSNQVVLSGTNQTLDVPNGMFCLEYLEMESGKTVTIEDGDGNTIASGVSAFNNDRVPLRCDLGVTLTGDVTIAKGFVLEQCFHD